MVAFPLAQRLKLPIAPLGGGLLGLMFALAVTAAPADVLEGVVTALGLPGFVPAAAPPLGVTARLLLGMVGGVGIALTGWGVLLLVVGQRAVYLPLAAGSAPKRREAAKADLPTRAPIRAMRDLGTPFLDVRADAPPAAVPPEEPRRAPSRPSNGRCRAIWPRRSRLDPDAIPDAPCRTGAAGCTAVRVPVPAPLPDPEPARIETFELTPHLRAPRPVAAWAPQPLVRPSTEASLTTLLDRLEAGVARAVPVPARRRA